MSKKVKTLIFWYLCSNYKLKLISTLPNPENAYKKQPREIHIQLSKEQKQDAHVYSEDELDLKIFQGTLAALKGTMKSAGEAFRIVGDTTAGITGGGLKAAGASIQGLGGSLDVLSTLISGTPPQHDGSEDVELEHKRKRQGPVSAVKKLAAGGVRIVGMASEELGDVVYSVGKNIEQVTSGTGNLLGGFFDGLEHVLNDLDVSLDVIEVDHAPPKKKEVSEKEELVKAPVRSPFSNSTEERMKAEQEKIKKEEHQPSTVESIFIFLREWWHSLFSSYYGISSLAPNFGLVCGFCFWLGWSCNCPGDSNGPKNEAEKRMKKQRKRTPRHQTSYQMQRFPSVEKNLENLKSSDRHSSRKFSQVKRCNSIEANLEHLRLDTKPTDQRIPPSYQTLKESKYPKPDFDEKSKTNSKRVGKLLLRMFGTFFIVFVLWIWICTLDQSNRRRLCLLAESKAWKDIMEQQQNKVETAFWVNMFLKSLWILQKEGKQISTDPGGLGPYLSELVAESLEEELQLDQPSSVTNLKLKECTLGTGVPIVRGVKVLEAWTDADSLHTFQKLELDLDLSFPDLSIIFSFKLSSLEHAKLPYSSIQVTNLLLHGKMTTTFELLPDYPFFGVFMLSFNEMPDLSVNLKPLRGLDISSIPGLGTWVSMAVEKMVYYYVHPNFYAYDLESLICPDCVGESIEEDHPSSTKKGLPPKGSAVPDIKTRSSGQLPGWQLLKDSKSRRGLDPKVPPTTTKLEPQREEETKVTSVRDIDQTTFHKVEKTQHIENRKRIQHHSWPKKLRLFFKRILHLDDRNEGKLVDIDLID